MGVVTMKDVARKAGVSVGTVSNVLNGKPNVSSQLRRKVERAVKELGYQRKRKGDGPVRNGFVTVFGLSIKNKYTTASTALTYAVKQRAEEHGIQVIEYDNENSPEKQIMQINEMIERKMDAIICTPVQHDSLADSFEKCRKSGIPIILLNRDVSNGEPTAAIVSDNEAAGRDLALYAAISLNGRQGNILEIRGEQGDLNCWHRHKGFTSELEKWPHLRIVTDYESTWTATHEWDNSYEITMQALAEHPDINVIFCHTDASFRGVIRALEKTDRLYPQSHMNHLLLLGVDGSNYALEQIRTGYADCLSEQRVWTQAIKSVDMALEAAQAVPKTLGAHYLNTILVTRHNIDHVAHWADMLDKALALPV